MPIGRILLKSISSSRKLALLKTDGARLLYTWLIPHLNKHGCYEADPLVVRNNILSRLDKTIKEVEDYLNDLDMAGLIQRYNVNGDTFLFVPDFKDKQPNLRPEREGKTHIPLPTPDLLQTYSRPTPEESNLNKIKLIELNNKCLFPFNEIWFKYPNRIGKRQSEKSFHNTVKTEQDWVNINLALKNYLSSERVAKGYVQNAKTWFNNWSDWVSYKEEICPKCKGTGKWTSTTGYENFCNCAKGRRLQMK